MNCKKLIFNSLIVCFILITTSSLSILAKDQKDGKAIFESKCNQCHPLSKSLSKAKSLKKWKKTTLRMSKKKNSNFDKKEAEIIAEYLSSITIP